MWIVEPRPVPPLAPSSRHLMHVVMPGTPRALFDCVLADSAPFFEDFLDSQVRGGRPCMAAASPWPPSTWPPGHCVCVRTFKRSHPALYVL